MMNKHNTLTPLLSWLCLITVLYVSMSAVSAESVTQQRAAIESQLTHLEKAGESSAEIGFYQQALAGLNKIEKENSRRERLTQRISQLSDDLNLIEKQAAEFAAKQPISELKKTYLELTPNELDVIEAKILANMQVAQNALSVISNQLTNLQTLPERTQISMSQGYQQNQAARSRLSNTDSLSDGEKVYLQVESELLALQQAGLQQELENRTELQELAFKQRDYQNGLLARSEKELQLLQEVISFKRLNGTEQDANSLGGVTTFSKQPLIKQVQTLNQQLSKQLIDSVSITNSLMKMNLQAKSWLEQGTQIQTNLAEQVQMLKGSLILSRILYQTYQQLDSAPSIKARELETQIADLHLAQYDLNQLRDKLANKKNYIASLIANGKYKLTDAEKEYVNKLIDNRMRLVNQLNRQLDSQLSSTINLQLTQQQMQRVYDEIKFTLQQNVFWVSSNKPIDGRWLLNWPNAIYNQALNLAVMPDFALWYEKLPHVVVPALFLVLIGLLLLWKRPVFTAKLKQIDKNVVRFLKDSQWNTPKALFFVALQRLPISLFIMAIGLLFTFSNLLSSKVVFLITINLALGQLVFSMYMEVLQPNGIAERHFRSNKDKLQTLHARMRYLWLPILPLIILSTKGVMEPFSLGDDVIGRTLSIVLLGLTTYLLVPIARSMIKNRTNMATAFCGVVMALTPLALMVLTIFGYYYTALKLTGRLIESFYLIILWLLVYSSVLRGLSLAARRLAYRRAVAKRDLKAQEESSDSEAFEEQPLSFEEVNQQSLRVTRTILVLVFGLGFYWLWSDLVAIFSYLDSVILWQKVVGTGAAAQIIPISLNDVITALALLLGLWSLSRNLPGLLEVLVLSRMKLAQGSGYAITTLINYVLTGVVGLTALSMLGMPWDKLQWLAAGLTVGIGFGLQEVVGNFVSGIIILFERPIRIGDTVTIGTFSGTVSKIRIRATTVIDFDRKEVIIPNKLVMTERLINWSLSDTVTRLIIRVGVAYGSDLDLTKKLLNQAASECHLALKDPAPLVYFLTFGASTLDHELRFFVSEMADRNPAIDDINRKIDKLFQAHDIQIAFNQVDVFIKNNLGDEQHISLQDQTAILGAAAGAGAAINLPPPPPKN